MPAIGDAAAATVADEHELTQRRRVTIREIARELKLSVTAVSRGLRGDPGIGEGTRLRIHRVATRLGYVPNAAAAGLPTGRTFKTLFVVPYDIRTFPHLFHMEVLEGLVDELSGHGYSIDLLFDRTLRRRGQTALEALRAADADGAVLVLMAADDIGEPPARFPLPVVAVNCPAQGDADCVIADDEQGAAAATRHLVEAGHRTLAHIAGPSGMRSNRKRREGFEGALLEAGMKPSPELIEAAALTREDGYRAMRSLLSRKPDISAVFCCRDIMAVGAMQALSETGRRVPEDVSIVGFDDEVFADLITPPLTTIRKPRREMGAQAGRLLLGRLGAKQSMPPRNVTLKTRLVERGSVAPYRSS